MDARELKLAPLFADLDKNALKKVALLAETLDIAPGKEIASEGKIAWDLFVIDDGTADVSQDGQPIGTLGPGDFFGEIGLLGGSDRRTATVTATSPMRLIVLSAGRLATIEREMPGVSERVRAALAERMARDGAAPAAG
jgi:CRP/FNR family transcriptional regulator, cyclic AMP receptor protein